MYQQKARRRGFFQKSRSFLKRIDIPPLIVGESKQYPTSSPELRNLFRAYGCLNWINVRDSSDTIMKIMLDNNFNRSYTTGEYEGIADLEFTSFTIENVGTDDLLAGEFVVFVGYNVEGVRANYLIERFLGGNKP